MDINTLRSIMTVLSMMVFIGIVIWAYSKKQQAAFDEAARSVLDDEDLLTKEGK